MRQPYFEAVPTGEPFSRSTGFVDAECVNRDGVSYLEITVNADPADPRVDDIGGDLPLGFGLHIVDANLGMGDFLDIVRRQAKAFAQK